MAAFAVLAVLLLSAAGRASAQCSGLGSTAQAALFGSLAGVSSVPVTPGTKPCPGIAVQYAGGGSRAGQDGIGKKAWDFALSDTPLNCRQANTIANVPYAYGVNAVYAKVKGVTGIYFTACGLARIYRGIAKTWNDPTLIASDVRLKTVTDAISAIRRADDSGTTWVFTNFLGKACAPQWRYGTLFNFNAPGINDAALKAYVARSAAISARSTGDVAKLYAGIASGAIVYAAAQAKPTGSASPLPTTEAGYLQANTPLQFPNPKTKFIRFDRVSWAKLVAAGTSTPWCSIALDVTARRDLVYPFVYLGFFLAWAKAGRANNKPCVKTLCTCLINPPAQAVINSNPDFHGLNAALIAQSRARCNLL